MAKACAIVVCFALLTTIASASSSCSSESHVVGNGACDAFCNKLTGAQCKVAVERARCLDECLWYQQDCDGWRGCVENECSAHQDDFLRCVTVDGNVLCDVSSGKPTPVGCDYFLQQRRTYCVQYVPEAGLGALGSR